VAGPGKFSSIGAAYDFLEAAYCARLLTERGG
jgi:hypothetical protein